MNLFGICFLLYILTFSAGKGLCEITYGVYHSTQIKRENIWFWTSGMSKHFNLSIPLYHSYGAWSSSHMTRFEKEEIITCHCIPDTHHDDLGYRRKKLSLATVSQIVMVSIVSMELEPRRRESSTRPRVPPCEVKEKSRKCINTKLNNVIEKTYLYWICHSLSLYIL